MYALFKVYHFAWTWRLPLASLLHIIPFVLHLTCAWTDCRGCQRSWTALCLHTQFLHAKPPDCFLSSWNILRSIGINCSSLCPPDCFFFRPTFKSFKSTHRYLMEPYDFWDLCRSESSWHKHRKALRGHMPYILALFRHKMMLCLKFQQQEYMKTYAVIGQFNAQSWRGSFWRGTVMGCRTQKWHCAYFFCPRPNTFDWTCSCTGIWSGNIQEWRSGTLTTTAPTNNVQYKDLKGGGKTVSCKNHFAWEFSGAINLQ